MKQAAIVIDDLGWLRGKLEDFLALDIPLTFAILPGERYSEKLAEKAHAAGHEVILHLPMEPEGYPKIDPGPRALFSLMEPEAVRKTFREDVAVTPHVSGVNNHMGSRFIQDRAGMRVLFQELRSSNLYFMDSRTSPGSVAKEMAREYHVPYLENQVFLDNKDDKAAITAQLEKLLHIAEKNGHAVGIGHIQRKHIVEAIRALKPEFAKHNVEFVTLSQVLKGASYARLRD